MYNLASWNIKGMNQAPKQKEVHQVILENNMCLCAILESHVAKDNVHGLCSKVFKRWNWTSNSLSCMKSSRIIMGWNPDILNVVVIASDDQVMHTCVLFKADKKEVFCSVVYAHNNYIHRRALWKNLKTHKGYVRGRPWVVLGDFNVSLSAGDKSTGSSYIDTGMRDFQECVEDIEVMDVNSTGLKFTWNQKPKGDSGLLKKIDRIMSNLEFSANFVGSCAVFQPYRTSDHAPAVLRIPMNSMKRPHAFKFFNLLVHNTRFKEVVSNVWQQTISGFWMFKVVKRLKLLKKPLRKLLFDHGNIHENVKKIRHELDEAQKDLDSDPSNVELREEEAAYLHAYQDAILMEERLLVQKAKIDWLKLGDANTAYFHKVVKSQTARNRIDSIVDNNGATIDGDQVPLAFIDHYTEFLGQPGTTTVFHSNDIFCNRLSMEGANSMIREVSDKEIKDTMFSMGDNKALGPDGFSAAFFKEAWDIIGVDVCKAIKEFFTNGILLKELNHTIIALIPKVNSPVRINDYRPISCCNTLYKRISKILANRMKESLSKLISLNQSAFVSGRRISDNILLTQEFMHNYHLDRGPARCAFKVDIQKAYDTVDWLFLKDILTGFGFHHRMIGWIMECVMTTSFSLSINGCSHGFFKGMRGLRQGDPISPYLFTLVMEVLMLMLNRRARESNRFTYHRYCSMLNIINLCFADDLFLFAHGDENSARVIMDSLEEFKNASGLTPSLPKSTAYFCNVLNYVKIRILSILPFEEGTLPVKHLGVPLVPSRLVYRDCSDLMERIKKRINDWKNKVLSFAGRTQLIRSVLGSMHVYWASVFILPSSLMHDLEQVIRGFLWCQGEMKRGKAKVAWEVVCLPKKEGGLGIRSPLSNLISNKDIYRAGLGLDARVSDIVLAGLWVWPTDWLVKYPPLANIVVPNFTNAADCSTWLNRQNMEIPRHAIHLWLVIKRKLKTQDTLRHWDVWECVKSLTSINGIPSALNYIVDFIIPLAHRKSARSVTLKLVFAAACYFLWQERNNRLFKKTKRTQDQICGLIKDTVRLKLMSCSFKKSSNVQSFLQLWQLPNSLMQPVHD
ncbi:putative RNA-directed DNA polymerase [Tanacetum coccineum]